jgi:hypothetical protein
MKVKIEITHLKGNDTILYQCSIKQIQFIEYLMSQRNMSLQFQKYFTFNKKPITNHLSKANASKLISGLLKGNEIIFTGVDPMPIMKEGKLKVKYKQPSNE